MVFNKKIAIVSVVGLLLAIAAGVFLYKKSRPFDPGVDIKTFTSAKQYEDYYKNLLEVYKKDTYGGKTPEETLQLFIDALKKGDVELAAKYFVPEKQEKEAEELKVGKEKNNLDFLLSFLEQAGYGKLVREGVYQMVVTKDNKAVMTFDFVLNNYTNVWKIQSL